MLTKVIQQKAKCCSALTFCLCHCNISTIKDELNLLFCNISPLQINSLSIFCLFSSLRHERAQAVCGQRAEPVWYGPHGASGSPLPQDRGELGQATRHRLASFSVGCVVVRCAALEVARSQLLFLMWLRVVDFETIERNL